MSNREEVLLQSAVVERLARLSAGLGAGLGGALRRLLERLEMGRTDGPGYFLHPLALPVLQLPLWTAARCGDPAPGQDAAEAAALGYLHVRIQDDLVDEGVGEGHSSMLLASALFTRHQRLLAELAGERRAFRALFEARWLGYAEAMLLERALHDGEGRYDEAAFGAVLGRSRPLVLPAAAVLFQAERGEALPALERFVEGLIRAHQLFTDLIDAERDLANGNLTWVVQRLGGPEGRATLRRRLYLEGGFDEVMAEITLAMTEAREAADTLALPRACADYLDRRQALMDQTRRQLFQALFNQLLRP